MAAVAGMMTPGCKMCELVEAQCNFCKAKIKKMEEKQKQLVELQTEIENDQSGGAVAIATKRPTQNGANRIKNVGIHTIEIYVPQFFTDQYEMEVYDSAPDRFGPGVIGKYTKGVGQREFRFTTDDEDPISFGMTVIHRLIERMQREGFNETYKFSEDGKNLNPWNAFGCFNVGSESLLDRSKSMKSYMMDLFERYGEGEANMEGVDHYNACYGGQAAFFNVMNWMESDRWDGRYGLAIATDISDAESPARFTMGAACTGTLVYPDAPVWHQGVRATCILHRFDFFKPVGWHAMAPIVDGKYSIECYMQSIDLCCQKMREKLGGESLLKHADYNVFHTGGGYHVVRKAFERLLRAEEPSSSKDQRQQYFDQYCAPSTHLLRVIGPCHTVSSFTNIFSVLSSQWDKAFGKKLLVFTYGSGSTASMYTLKIDDLIWMESLERWMITFYRKAIKCTPAEMMPINDCYENTWMKFNFTPEGRKKYSKLSTLQFDVYYLMEVDGWGRRFYHRGGLRAPPMDESNEMYVDKVEQRSMREKFGDAPEEELEEPKPLEDIWKEIEYEMTYEAPDEPEFDIIEETYDKVNPLCKFVIVKEKEDIVKKPQGKTIENDGLPHTYQIIGTWTQRKKAEEMIEGKDDEGTQTWSYTVTVGENCWEQFHLIQDNDWKKRIYPAAPKSWKGMPCVGPTPWGEGHHWMLDGRDRRTVPECDKCRPGDKFKVTFKWPKGHVKDLAWDKVEDETTAAGDSPAPSLPQTPRDIRGKYYIAGSWSCFGFQEMTPDSRRDGLYSIQVQMTSLGLSFQIVRDEDWSQVVYPEVPEDDKGTVDSRVRQDEDAKHSGGRNWVIEGGELGDIYQVDFFRNPLDYEDMKVQWAKVSHSEVKEPAPRYFYAGSSNGWGLRDMDGHFTELQKSEKEDGVYTVEVECKHDNEEFQIVVNKVWQKCIHPDTKETNSQTKHEVKGPDDQGQDLNWIIGKSVTDKYRRGDIFEVKLETKAGDSKDQFKVSWTRLRAGEKKKLPGLLGLFQN